MKLTNSCLLHLSATSLREVQPRVCGMGAAILGCFQELSLPIIQVCWGREAGTVWVACVSEEIRQAVSALMYGDMEIASGFSTQCHGDGGSGLGVYPVRKLLLYDRGIDAIQFC